MAPQDEPIETQLLAYGEAAIAAAARLILAGEPVAIPTETVYGLAADATSEAAVARIYEAKRRPSFNPLIVHVLDADHASSLGADLSEAAREIVRLYWPGPLTIVVPLDPLSPLARNTTGGLDTVALRSPRHRAMRALLEACGRPLAAPSANASGRLSPTTAAHVLQSLGGRIPLIVDDGPTSEGIESTIVKIADGIVTILRPGPVDGDEVVRLAKLKLAAGRDAGVIESPGQMRSHYAPSKPLRLEAGRAEPDEWFIGFGAMSADDSLSETGDLDEAAARLFAALHRADSQRKPRIAVAPIPAAGLGLAINDRLRRAAAPRED
jgi:L-threonylcarbamoyladenylate synthase